MNLYRPDSPLQYIASYAPSLYLPQLPLESLLLLLLLLLLLSQCACIVVSSYFVVELVEIAEVAEVVEVEVKYPCKTKSVAC